MQQGYSRELESHYLEEEQKAKKAGQAREEREQLLKRIRTLEEKASENASSAQLAFEQTQVNRFECERLKKELAKVKRIAIAAIFIAIVCMAIAMGS